MRTQNVVAVVAAVAAISIPTTQAQKRPGTPPTLFQPPNGSECPPSVGKNAPSSNEATGSRTLSDQLSQSRGVICPPAGIDPKHFRAGDRRWQNPSDSTAWNPGRRSEYPAKRMSCANRPVVAIDPATMV
jgi:hypothetical protein